MAVSDIFERWKKPSHIQLHAGEMTQQELRSVIAVVKAVQAEVTAALSDQVAGWRPIETAPKIEGLYVDLWFPQRVAGEYGRVPDCLWIAKTTTPGWYADCEHSDEIYYLGDGATHWSYRPKFPPADSGEER